MNTQPLLITALVMLPAAGLAFWAWWTTRAAGNDLRVDSGLEQADLHIGTWPAPKLISAR